MLKPIYNSNIFLQVVLSTLLGLSYLGGGYGNRDLACEMLIAFDEPIFSAVLNESVAKATQRAEDYISRINDIYQRTFLNDDHMWSKSNFNRVYFRLREIRILFDFCTKPECNTTQKYYLKEFEKFDTSDFCLAHVFTYRDFPKGIQGLAWKNTTCRENWNTGFTTVLNHQHVATLENSAMTFSHEVGHNFGAIHDEESPCGQTDPPYIMSSIGSSSHNLNFTSCSLKNMSMVLDEIVNNEGGWRRNCLVNRDQDDNPKNFSFCGNSIREGFEECDCGLHYMDCDDPCCYAAYINPSDLQQNASAVPCRKGRVSDCQNRFHSILVYAVYGPLVFIASVIPIVTILLIYDWKCGKRIAFRHMKSSVTTQIPSSLPVQNGIICNGQKTKDDPDNTSNFSPMSIPIRYVKRMQPVNVACTSSSASSPFSETRLNVSETISVKTENSDYSSKAQISDGYNSANVYDVDRSRADARFNQMIQNAPNYSKRYLKESMGLPTLTSTTNYNINLLPNIKPSVAKKSYDGNKEQDIDLVPRRRAPLPPSQQADQSSSVKPIFSNNSSPIPEYRKSLIVKRPPEPPPSVPNVFDAGSKLKQ